MTSTSRAAAPPTMPLSVKLALVFLALMLIVAVLADLIAPFDYAAQNLGARLRPPPFVGLRGPASWTYPLGTDNLGRDVLSRLIYGIRTSVLIAVGATLIGATIGTALGFLAAHFRGWLEEAILMFVDVQASVPYIIVALAALAFFGNSLILFIILIGLEGWERYARLTRGLVLAEKGKDYALAASSFGAGRRHIYLRHILRNIAGALIVQATIYFPWMILIETSISFLGLGVQPPRTSLGLMMGQGRNYLINAWWIAIFPGVAIFFTTLSVSLFGDWLRDKLDPTLKDR